MVKGMKKRLLSVLLALFMIIGILPATPAMAASTVALSSMTTGDTVNFAGYTWYVLDPSTGYLFMKENYYVPYGFLPIIYGYGDSVPFDAAEYPLNMFPGSSMEAVLNDSFFNSLPSADRALIQKHAWDYGNIDYHADVTYGPSQYVDDYVGLISFKDWVEYSTEWYSSLGFLDHTVCDHIWTISTVTGDSQKEWCLDYEYRGSIHSKSITEVAGVRPALYLDPSTPVTGGTSGNGGTVLPFDAGQSTVTASPAQVPADGFDAATVTVTLKDSGGNPAGGMPIKLETSSGNSRITPPAGGSGGGAGAAASGTTDSSGKAVFTVTNTAAETVTYTATDTLDNVTVGTTSVQFVPVKTMTLNPTSLNRPYYSAGAYVIGTGTHFVSGTTTLRIFNSGGENVAGSVTLTVTSATGADFDLPDMLPADTYTVLLTTGTEIAAATLTVNPEAAVPTISTQPQNTTANAGSTATFSVAASVADGGTLSYQWQSLKSGGSWTNVGTNAAAYTTPVLAAGDNGTKFRCRVTNTNSTGAKNTVNSDAATLYVSGAGLTLPLASLNAGDTVNFAGYTWIVLDPSEGHLLMKNLYNGCAYDSSHTGFDTAAIRSLLNSTFYSSLPSADSALIQKHNWQVSSINHDGTVGGAEEYVKDYIGLITYQDWQAYSKYYNTASGFLDNPGSRFWTLTKVPSYGQVWYVESNGTLTYMSPPNSAYARPALYLDPAILLSGNGGSGSTVVPFDVSQSTVTASPGKLSADGTASSAVTVTLKDSGGTPVSGVAVTLASSSGHAVITPPSGGSGGGSAGASAHGTTDGSGAVTFTVTDTTAEQVTCTATADAYNNDTLGTADIEFAALKFTSADNTAFTAGKAGSFTVVAAGGLAPSLTATGSLPTGISFTDNGDGTATIAGTSNEGGTYPLVITAASTDPSLPLPSVSQNFSLKINRVPTEKAPLPTATATVGTSTIFTASDIAEDEDGDTLTITAITAPPASGTATADLSGGTVTVTGVAPGSASVEVAVSDGTDTANISVPITVDSAKPTITTTSLVSGKINEAYSAALSATGDTPITWSIESGDLPDGLSLSGNTISGTVASRGTFTFTVKAENSLGSDTKELSIVIIGIAPTITTATYGGLYNGTQGEYYCDTLTATGDGPITWTIYSGGMPPGLTLDANTGVIYGIPTQANGYLVYVKATNSAGSDMKALQITTYTEFAVITTNSLSGGTVGSAYSEELSARGNAPITWSVESGSLPDGLSLSSDGTISGTPTKAGTFTFTLKADANIFADDWKTFTIVVNASNSTVPVINISDVPATATADIPLTLTGTVEPADATNRTIIWSVRDAGTTGATVSGNTLTATAVGTVTVRATVTDSLGNPDYTQEFTIMVKAHPPIVTGVTVNPPVVSLQAGNTQTFSATVSGAYNPAQSVTWSVSGNNIEYTGINVTGRLTVDEYETATALTITATSTVDNTKSGTATVTVIPVQHEYQSVWEIYDVPTKATAGTPLALTGTVDPYFATNQTIVWSVQNAGTTGATVSGNILSTTGAGVVVVRATITNGLTESSDYTQDFNITVKAAFVPVTGITGVPTMATAGTDLTLTGTVVPGTATNQTIAWSVKTDGGTNASISGSTLSTTAAGTVTVTATITHGLTASSNYTQDFNITVHAASTYAASITPTGKTFTAATAGYGLQTAQTFTIENTGTGTVTELSASLTDGTNFEISTALSSDTLNPGGTATVSVRPRTGLAADTYADTLSITGNNGISLTADLSFTVNAETSTDKTLVSITSPTAITGVANGTAKTAVALGLPTTVMLVTDGGNVTGDVTWYVAASSYNPSDTSAQTFAVSGAVTLPGGVVNTNDVDLNVTLSVTVNAAPAAPTLTIGTVSLDNAAVGSSYSKTIAVTYTGSGTLTFSATGLPGGLSINSGTGKISGTPDNGTDAGSPYSVEVAVGDGTLTDTETYSLTVNTAPPVDTAPIINTNSPLPSGTVNMPYTVTLTATSAAAVTWVLYGGSLPDGLTLSSGGVISGTPAAAGTFNFTVKAANAAGDNTKALSIVISAVPTYTASVSPTSKTFTAAAAGYSQQTAQVFTIENTGTGTITGLSAALGGTDFEISTALSVNSLNSGRAASVSVRPGTGLPVGTYTDMLAITGNHGISLTVSLSFTVSVASPTVTSVTITASAGSGGSISPNGVMNVTTGGSATFMITPSQGYRIDTVTVDGVAQGAITTYTFANITANHTINATFTGTSGDGGGGDSPPGGGSVPSGGGSTATATPTYNADVKAGNGSDSTLPVTVNTGTGSAGVDVGSGSGMMSGGKTTVITVPSIPGVTAYTLGIPVAYLSTPGGKGTLTFNTNTGSITLPADMLAGVAGAEGKKAEITISQGDKSTLPEAAKAAIGNKPLIQLAVTLDGKNTDWNNPDAPITISIPYAPAAAEHANPESIIIWYMDGNGRAVSVPNGHYDPVTGTVTFATTHFSYYAVGYNKVSFTDVAETSWYGKAVGFIAARGITSGTGNGKYSPDAKLTRGEYIVMLMKAYSIVPDANAKDNFSDAGNTYYTGYLAAAKRLGISAGTGNNMFAPEKEITRQEMFTLLYNALKAIRQLPQGDSGKALSDFTDAGQVDSWAKEAMTLLVKTATAGGNAGKLTPLSPATRAEMAQVLYSLLSKKV
jgi:hypothetical protein